MSAGDPERSKKHSQDKVLRAFLEHVTGAHPVPKSGSKPSQPPAVEASGPEEPAAGRPRISSSSYGQHHASGVHPAVLDEGGAPRERKRDTSSGRKPAVHASSRVPGMAMAPTEIRPSPHAGVTPVPGDAARTAAGQIAAVVVPSRGAVPVVSALPAGMPTVIGPGAVLGGKYRLVRLLGRGGVGEVYEALHDVIGLRVAVKLIRFEYAGNSELNARFLQEARAAASVGHPGIVQIHDVGTSSDGRTYLVMEYLDGEDMEKVLARQRQLSLGEAAAILVDVLDALGAAHAKGIVHRDMKPENVFLVPGRKGERTVKLLDFGIARLADEGEATIRLTRPGAVMGTPYYMSPEQARGEANVDASVDLYAVGVMLYEALTGRLPYTGSSYNEVLSKVLAEPFPSVRAVRPDVPEEAEQVVQRATARLPADRYPDAAAFAAALAPFRPHRVMITLMDQEDGEPAPTRTPSGETPLPATARSSAPPPPPRRHTPPPTTPRAPTSPAVDTGVAVEAPRGLRRRVRVWLVAGGLVAVLVAVGLFLGLRPGGGAEEGRQPAAGAGVVPASVEIRVLHAPADATVKFDGREVGREFKVPSAFDEHVVEVSVPGGRTVVRAVRPTADLTLDLQGEFRPPAPSP